MNPENAIEVRNMSKSFKVQYDRAHDLKSLFILHKRGKVSRIQVLKDISLDIKKGETVALVGTNGSGKSTLLKLMTKIYYPNSGTIEQPWKPYMAHGSRANLELGRNRGRIASMRRGGRTSHQNGDSGEWERYAIPKYRYG